MKGMGLSVQSILSFVLSLILISHALTFTQFDNLLHDNSEQNGIIPAAFADSVPNDSLSAVKGNLTSLGFHVDVFNPNICNVGDLGSSYRTCLALSGFEGSDASGGNSVLVEIKFWKNSTLAGQELQAKYNEYNNDYKSATHNGLGVHFEQFNSSSGAPSIIYYIEHSTGGGGGYLQTSDMVEALMGDGLGEFQCGSITGSVDAESLASKGEMDTINNMKGDTTGAVDALSDQLSAQAGPAGKDWVNKITQALTSANLCGTPTHLPIIFLPGVGGTYLDAVTDNPGDNCNADINVWPVGTTDTYLMFLQGDGKTPLNPVKCGATYSIKTTHIFDRYISQLNFYGGMLDYLQTKGYTLNKDLFVFPYDWRMDNADQLPSLDQLVNQARVQTGQTKVILIAHSMGGLIGRAYVNTVGASKVDTLITLGTPFWGAAKPYYGLIDGYTFDNPFVTQAAVKILLQNSTAVYELNPWYPFILDVANKQYLSRDDSFNIHYKDVKTGITTFYDGTGNNWSPNAGLIQKAGDFYSKLGTKDSPVPLPSGVKHYVIIGTGLQTLRGFGMFPQTNEAEGYILHNADKVYLQPLYEDGDSTVPLVSAEISGATGTYYVQNAPSATSSHGTLAANPTVQKIVGSIIDGNPISPSTYSYQGGTVTLDSTDFTIHSNVHATITDEATGNTLGFNSNGGIDDTISGGTFLSMDGGTYVHINDASDTYKVTLNGTNNGSFTLITNVTKSGQSTVFSYNDVPVQQGTIAQVEVSPGQVSSGMPTLQVNNNGQSSTVSATSGSSLISAASSQSQAPLAAPAANLQIPSWVKKTAGWWSSGQVGDQDFVKGIEYMIKNGIMHIPAQQGSASQSASQSIPAWIKTSAGWWSSGSISDDDFVKGIQWLVASGIINVNAGGTLQSNPTSQPQSQNTLLQQAAQPLPRFQSPNGFFQMDRAQYDANASPAKMAIISGKITGANGGTAIFTITKPDGSIVPINGDVTNVGDFRTLVIIDATFPPGTYTISGNYQNTDLGSVTFTVK